MPRFRRTGSPRSHRRSAMLASMRRFAPRLSGSFYLATGLWLFVLALVILGAAAIYLPDWSHARSDFRPNASDVVSVFPILAFATVGALIASSQPRNRIGWFLIATAIAATFLSLPKFYAGLAIDLGLRWLPAPEWVYWVSQFSWIVVVELFLVLLPLYYPDGRLPGRRWRLVLWSSAAIVIIAVITALDPASVPTGVTNPMGIRALAGISNFLFIPFTVILLGTSLAAVLSLVVRYRRGDGQDRQRLKWLMAATTLLLLSFALNLTVVLNDLLIPLVAAAVPIAIGIAILRYRLYDIDLIINKTLVYGGLAAVITAVYVLVVINIGALVGGSQRLWLSLLTTAVIALAFQPLRARAQRLANRLVYGKRATPYEALSQFSEHLSETFSHEDILDRMARILAQGTGAERAEVWVRAGQRLVLASSSPPAAEPLTPLVMQNGTLPEMQRDTIVPVSHAGELLGALAVDKKRGETMNAVEQKMVTDLAGQAGLVLKNAGLNRELLARLDDLRASRQRLVTAQDEERRRIERNLHDGAQQHLIALKMKVGLAEGVAEPDSKARAILAQLKHDADEAIDNLRELARGIYPPLLASDGLGPALRAHSHRVTVPVELELEDMPRQPREVEGAIYFCCLEALQNVVKYAQASRVRLRVWLSASTITFRVEDDGKGFDPAAVVRSSGLQNMRDRLEALGGSITIQSALGKGTVVEGRLPLQA
ncbi:MAG: sensor histidine kinase [Chloroflexi bacterium]|nr:MAG: sensor histidine kinase [Chloroflexota bacterium]